MSQLPADCLNEIFEYLEKDKVALHSCLLVNRLWCEVAVRILWRNVLNYSTTNFSTLIAYLPNESKEILSKNGIVISTPNSKPLIFNYAAFCKILSVNQVNYMIEQLLNKNQRLISSQNLNNDIYMIITREIHKSLMKQISSLKKLYYWDFPNLTFTIYPETKDCLKNLSELDCSSNIDPEFFYQLSQICHNLLSLNIKYEKVISNGLLDLISVQKNLKCLCIEQRDDCRDLIPSLTIFPDTLIKLVLNGDIYYIPLLFISKFTNLRELELSFYHSYSFEDFETLQYVTYSQLQILKIKIEDGFSRYDLLIKFLEKNGENLKEFEFYVNDVDDDNSLNLSIGKFCSNLRKLSVGFKSKEALKLVLNSCQYLESIKVWCSEKFLNVKYVLEMIRKYSPKNFYELILDYLDLLTLELLTEELESLFSSWANRIPKKSLSLIIINPDPDSLCEIKNYMNIIEKYINLGVIKKFNVIDSNCNDDDDNDDDDDDDDYDSDYDDDDDDDDDDNDKDDDS